MRVICSGIFKLINVLVIHHQSGVTCSNKPIPRLGNSYSTLGGYFKASTLRKYFYAIILQAIKGILKDDKKRFL